MSPLLEYLCLNSRPQQLLVLPSRVIDPLGYFLCRGYCAVLIIDYIGFKHHVNVPTRMFSDEDLTREKFTE
jgi:hypothetical protein